MFLLNPYKPRGLFYHNSLDRFISYIRSVWLVFIILSCFVEISELNTNSVNPDQTPRSAASDQGVLCLPVPLLLDARHTWVKIVTPKVAGGISRRYNPDKLIMSLFLTGVYSKRT